jgi:peptide/nickel transport system substrate-binding protein
MEIENMTENKKQYRRGAVAVAVVAAAALALTGCSGTSAPKKSTETLTISSALQPNNLNPAISGNGRAGVALYPAYEPLVRTKADGTIEAALATAWKASDDLKSVTYTIRQNVKFSNGEALTPDAVKNSILFYKGFKGFPYAANLNALGDITVSGNDVTINFTSPQPDIASMFNAAFNYGDVIAPAGLKNPDDLSKNTYGAGPYMIDASQTVSGTKWVYVPNPNYYDQSKIYWPKIELSYFADQNSAIQAFKSGQIMYMISDAVTANANAATLPAGAKVLFSPAQWTGVIFTDRNGDKVNPALGNVKVRQALNYATDKNAITKALFGDFGKATNSLQVDGFIGYDKSLDSAYPYDPAKAKALLAEAGYASGLTINLAYVKNTLNQGQFEAIQSQWKEVGVTVNPVILANVGEFAAQAAKGTVGALLAQSNSNTPYIAYNQPLAKNGSYNIYQNTNPELDKLYQAAVNAPQSGQEAAWKAVHKWVVDNAWFDVIAALSAVAIASNKVTAPVPGASLVTDIVNIVPKG